MPRKQPETTIPEPREPWQCYPSIWKTEAAFWAYIRGSIRGGIWKRFPAKLEWKKQQMQPPPAGYTGRAKSMGTCVYCGELFAASHLEVDHISQAGSCNSWESAVQFIQNLTDCDSNWCLACRPCHKVKSYAERTGMDFKAALIEKQVISTMKLGKAAVLDILKKHGYNSEALRNDKLRREALTHILTKKGRL